MIAEGRRKKEEGRRKKEEGRGKSKGRSPQKLPFPKNLVFSLGMRSNFCYNISEYKFFERVKFMNSLISVQTLIEYIEVLPDREQTLLIDELFRRKIIKQHQENIDTEVKLALESPIEPGIKKVNMTKLIQEILATQPLIIGEEIENQCQENTKQTVKTKTLLTGNTYFDICAADSTNFEEEIESSNYHVIVKNESDKTVSAMLLGWPECKAFGETRSQALQNLQDLVNSQLAAAEIISVKLTASRSNNPWVSLAGKYENDPQYSEVLAHIEEYRRELDAEMEAYYSQLDAESQAK
ncbi:MAG: type II toxin-antitoxin system HicB family antitoxin [Microcoleus sp.]